MATEVLQLGIDSTGAAQGARQFERATTSVQQAATKADAATNRMEGGFNKLRSSAVTLTRVLGTLGITIGAGALVRSIAQATAEMDTMQRGLVAIMGSASAAGRELETLRRIALAPGIDLKAAVQGATQLQAVGIGLKTTNRALVEFANAVALSGGGGPALERVVLQLQQLSSKGKVLSQDLRPILEAAPSVAQALKAAFGTVNADDIQNLGLTSDQFLTRLLDAMAKLPRATGGVANGWENLKSAVFQASAALGTQFVGSVAPALTALSDLFTGLSQNTKLLREIADGAKSLAKAIGVVGLAAAVYYLADAFGALLISTTPLLVALGPAGAILAGVGVLTALFYRQGAAARAAASGADEYAKSLSRMNRAQTIAEFRDVQRRIEGLKQMPQTSFVVGETNKLGAERQLILAQLAGMRPQSAPPTPPVVDVDPGKLAAALDAAFGKLWAQFANLMPRLANNDDIVAARGGLGGAGALGIPNFEHITAGSRPDYSGVKGPGALGTLKGALSGVGGALRSQVASLAAQFGPLAIAAATLAPVFQGLKDVIAPVLAKLSRPLEVMGRILGDVVTPVLELLQEPLEAVATLFSVLAQPLKLMVELFKAYVTPGLKILSSTLKIVTSGLSYIVEGIGYVVKGLGDLVDKLVPDFISHAGKGLAKTGQDIIDGAERARHGFDAVATASDKLAASLSTDLPKAINLALYRARIGAPGGGSVAGGPIGGGGGVGSGYRPPVYTPGGHPQPAPAASVSISIGQYHSADNETPEDAARKMAKGAQILASQGVKLHAPALVVAA